MGRAKDLKDAMARYEVVKAMIDGVVQGPSTVPQMINSRATSPNIAQRPEETNPITHNETPQTTSYSNVMPYSANQETIAGRAWDAVDLHYALNDHPIRVRNPISGEPVTNTSSPRDPTQRFDVMTTNAAHGVTQNRPRVPIEHDSFIKQPRRSEIQTTSTTNSPHHAGEPIPHQPGDESKFPSNSEDIDIPTQGELKSSGLFLVRAESPSVMKPTLWREIVGRVREISRKPVRRSEQTHKAPPSHGSSIQDPAVGIIFVVDPVEKSSPSGIPAVAEPNQTAAIDPKPLLREPVLALVTEPTTGLSEPIVVETDSVKRSYFNQSSDTQETIYTGQESSPVEEFNTSKFDLQSATDKPIFGHPKGVIGYGAEENNRPDESDAMGGPGSTERSPCNLDNIAQSHPLTPSRIPGRGQEPSPVNSNITMETVSRETDDQEPIIALKTTTTSTDNDIDNNPQALCIERSPESVEGVPGTESLTVYDYPLETAELEPFQDSSPYGSPNSALQDEHGSRDFLAMTTIIGPQANEPIPAEFAQTETKSETESNVTTRVPTTTAEHLEPTQLQIDQVIKDSNFRAEVTTVETTPVARENDQKPIPKTDGNDQRTTTLMKDHVLRNSNTISSTNVNPTPKTNHQTVPSQDERDIETEKDTVDQVPPTRNLDTLDVQEQQVSF